MPRRSRRALAGLIRDLACRDIIKHLFDTSRRYRLTAGGWVELYASRPRGGVLTPGGRSCFRPRLVVELGVRSVPDAILRADEGKALCIPASALGTSKLLHRERPSESPCPGNLQRSRQENGINLQSHCRLAGIWKAKNRGQDPDRLNLFPKSPCWLHMMCTLYMPAAHHRTVGRRENRSSPIDAGRWSPPDSSDVVDQADVAIIE